MTSLNCPDGLLLFLYKDLLLAQEARKVTKLLPRKTKVARLLDGAGITVISAQNKQEIEKKLKDQPDSESTLFLNTGKKAILDQLFRHLRNAVAHADYQCNQTTDKTVELFHEYQGVKRLFGTVGQRSLRKLEQLVRKDG